MFISNKMIFQYTIFEKKSYYTEKKEKLRKNHQWFKSTNITKYQVIQMMCL